jgi:hypothetical protein
MQANIVKYKPTRGERKRELYIKNKKKRKENIYVFCFM